MNKTQYNFLKKYERQFTTAHDSDYARPIMKGEMEKILMIYDEEKPKHAHVNLGCGSCILRMFKDMYEILKDYEKKVEKEPEPKAIEVPEKKKRGRQPTKKD